MSDLLSSASLLLAVLGVLYGLWYPEIIGALEVEIPDYSDDRKYPYLKITAVLFGRAIPLTIAGIGISIIFLPDALNIINYSIRNYQLIGFAALMHYNAVNTAFCFVVTLSFAIAIHLTIFSVKLYCLRNYLSLTSNKKYENKDID